MTKRTNLNFTHPPNPQTLQTLVQKINCKTLLLSYHKCSFWYFSRRVSQFIHCSALNFWQRCAILRNVQKNFILRKIVIFWNVSNYFLRKKKTKREIAFQNCPYWHRRKSEFLHNNFYGDLRAVVAKRLVLGICSNRHILGFRLIFTM